MPDALRQCPDGIDQLMELDKQWHEFDLMSIAEKVDTEFQLVAKNVRNHFSLLRICQNALKKREIASS